MGCENFFFSVSFDQSFDSINLTYANAFHWEGSLSQKIGVWEHVLLKHHKAQEAQLWFVHSEGDDLWILVVRSQPHGVQSIIIYTHTHTLWNAAHTTTGSGRFIDANQCFVSKCLTMHY